MTQAQRERELTFDVPGDWHLPDLTPLVADGSVEVSSQRLISSYFDTADRDLLAHGITLRRRTGDADQGWHLKLPAGAARTELRLPVGSDDAAADVPDRLRRLVIGVAAGAALIQVATVHTDRTVHRLHAGGGEPLAEVADDRVTATALGEFAVITEWREVEVELAGGDEKFLKRAARRLRTAGASRAAVESKLARALGVTAPVTRSAPTTLTNLVRDYLHEQCDVIVHGDIALRRKQEVIHSIRVATRRLRSVLRVFADQFDPVRAAALDAELAWYANLLGSVRDLQVLRAHLHEVVSGLPSELVLGPVTARIDETITRDERTARRALSRAMTSERYFELVRELRAWRDAPPAIGAERRVDDVADYVVRTQRALDKRLRRATKQAARQAAQPTATTAPPATAIADDAAFHRARKAGKRARYVAELAEPVLGRPARRLIKKGKQLQDQLGGLQDSVVGADFLRRLGAVAGTTAGENGFTFGVLWAHEIERARAVKASVR